MTATIEGRTYEIPEMWIAGYCRTHGGTAVDAAQAWHAQAQMETHVDVILRTSLSGIVNNPARLYGAERAAAIRALFRSLGWGKFFRITKGCWTLGTDIEWAKGMAPQWFCDRVMALREQRNTGNAWFEIPVCFCPVCQHREKQRTAIARRVHYVLNQAFAAGQPFGSRSDSQADYFDSDYTFHP